MFILKTLAFLVVLSLPQALLAQGGSNYIWYQQDQSDGTCFVTDYGVLFNYHEAGSTIDNQLQDMYNAGQRRLRIPIFHGRGWNNVSGHKWIMDSTDGQLSPTHTQNVTGFLAKLRQIGFSELEIAFCPTGNDQGGNDPQKWLEFYGGWSEDYYQENWNLIANLHPIIAGCGIDYRIDLMNEMVPPNPDEFIGHPWFAQFNLLTQYCRRLWTDYVLTFGKNDTVGFSLSVDTYIDSKIRNFANIYGGCPGPFCNGPYILSAHIYRDSSGDERAKFVYLDSLLSANGYPKENTGIIIGEAYYNDPVAAANFQAAVTQTGRTIFHVLQWPVTPTTPSTPGACLPLPTTQFNNYLTRGF